MTLSEELVEARVSILAPPEGEALPAHLLSRWAARSDRRTIADSCHPSAAPLFAEQLYGGMRALPAART